MEERHLKQRYAVGEFAKLSGVPKQTLQFYDKIGIFSPAYRAENGYRYYETDQFEAIDIIYSLKEAGLPLSEIKTYLNQRTPELCMHLLERESLRIQEKIHDLEQTLTKLNQKKISTSKGLKSLQDLTLKFIELPETHLFTWDFSEIDDSQFTLELFKMVLWCSEHGYYTGYAMGSILGQEALNTSNYSKINYMFTIIDKPTAHPNYRCRAAGLYAVYPYQGSYAKLPEIYPFLRERIFEAGFQIIGDSYETGLLDFFSTRNENEYLLEIAIPIKAL